MTITIDKAPDATIDTTAIIEEYKTYLNEKIFPCVAAKAALAHNTMNCMVAGHMACPKDDSLILDFLYRFVDTYRKSNELYHSAAIIFTHPITHDEATFEGLLWQRLQALSDLDAYKFGYDDRVNNDPSDPNFSFSLKEEAMFIIGLHPASSRLSRRFAYPTLVFNPHKQFEQLRASGKYDNLKHVVRKRDLAYSGSVNPMLQDFGEASEAYQYSGKIYNKQWQCPLNIKHATTHHHTTA